MDVQRLRGEIPALKNATYLNTGWSGPPPTCATEALRVRIALEAEQGPTTPGVYESGGEIQERARQAAAAIMGANVDETLVTRNTTEGLNIVVSGLDWREGDEIITCNLEHSSVLGLCYNIAQRYGARVRVAELDLDDSPEAIVEKFSALFTARTRLLFVSHIQYSTGLRMPAAELCRVAHSHGAQILLDGAQTGSHIQLDVHRDGFDYYSIPGQKWALGYEGVGALYIRRDLIDSMAPAHTGGRFLVHDAQGGSFRLSGSGMEKFLGGSGSVPLQAAFVEAARFIEGVGIGEIEARNVALALWTKEGLAEIPSVKVLTPMGGAESAGLVSFSVAGRAPDDVVASLWRDHRIVVRAVSYPACIRASLHFFNTEEEALYLVESVASLS